MQICKCYLKTFNYNYTEAIHYRLLFALSKFMHQNFGIYNLSIEVVRSCQDAFLIIVAESVVLQWDKLNKMCRNQRTFKRSKRKQTACM